MSDFRPTYCYGHHYDERCEYCDKEVQQPCSLVATRRPCRYAEHVNHCPQFYDERWGTYEPPAYTAPPPPPTGQRAAGQVQSQAPLPLNFTSPSFYAEAREETYAGTLNPRQTTTIIDDPTAQLVVGTELLLPKTHFQAEQQAIEPPTKPEKATPSGTDKPKVVTVRPPMIQSPITAFVPSNTKFTKRIVD